jgi:hypothetical protein
MKPLLRCFALIVLAGACSRKVDDPRVELTDVGFTLHLPPAMQHALDVLAPGFRTVRTTSFRSDVSQAAAATGTGGMAAAFASIADFDHDGAIDAVVEGTAPGDSSLRVIAIMNGAKPTAVEITRFPVFDADAVGVYVTNPPPGIGGAFEVVAYPDSTIVYEYRNGAFRGQNIGD